MASRRKPAHGAPPRSAARAALGGLTQALQAVSDWLAAEKVDFAVVGGVAASLHGKPRVTKDVDVVALADDATWEELVEAAAAHGIFPRVDEALDFAKNTRVLLLVHRPSKIEIDLSLGMLPFESDLVHRARAVDVGEVRFPLAAPEDVIVMKALALRPRDVADIEGIVESNAELDLERVRSTLSQLSAALESDDHLSRLDEILRSAGR